MLLAFVLTIHANAQTQEQKLQHIVDSVYAANPDMVGVIVHVEAPGKHISWDYATGFADTHTQQKLSANQPVLIASNTKTYIAATILKLVEQGKITVDQPIHQLLKPQTATLLTGVGYQLDSITIRQLLSHTSGIRDYTDNGYFDTVNAHPQHQWTRDEQIARAVHIGGPYARPADSFRYADLNYLLLSEIIETCTGKPFYKAVRQLMDFRHWGLRATWFVQLEKTPKRPPPFAHQYWNKYKWDAYNLNPSWDLYGGGGMAATASDMAMFYHHLFNGDIISDTQVLRQMYQDVPVKAKSNYCLGIRKLSIAGLTGYYHGGFWGTNVIYYPQINTSISVITLERATRDIAGAINKELTMLLN